MRVAAVVLVILGAPASLRAEPFRPRPENLHVSVSCADYWASSDRGLQVLVDGVPQRPLGENGASAIGYDSDDSAYVTWVTTDVGFALDPGVHHLAISAPGCSAVEEDIDTTSPMPIFVSGRLPVADPSLRGPTGAPDGIGVASGLFMGGRGAHVASNDILSSSNAFDPTSTTGGFLTMSVERRDIAFALDMMVAGGSTSGTATTHSSYAMPTGPSPFDGSALQLGMAARLGMRQRFGELALSEGAGIGGDMWIESARSGSLSTAPSSDADADYYVPLWAQVTYKPGCDWGAQVLAAYDVHPGSSNEDAPMVMAGLMWQPSSACREQAGLALR